MTTILLVDDEPSIRLALGDALERAGYDVVRASDGIQGLKLFETQTFDIVVTDVHMPEMDGLQFLRRLRALSPGTDVLLMTAFGKVADVIDGFKLGAKDYLTKPFTSGELLGSIASLVQGRPTIR